jgi:hypothetical protein
MSMSPIRRARLLAAALAAVAVLAGCGGGSTAGRGTGPSGTAATSNGVADLPAKEILARAQQALGRASSVHIKGGGSSEGQQFAIDMRYGAEGAVGSMTTNGQTIELLRVGQTVYLKGTEAFWRSIGGNAVAELLKGRYLKVPATTPDFAELSSFTDLKKNAQELLKPDGEVSKGGRRTVHGVQAIGLVDSKDGGTLYIALQGEPYPLQAVPGAKAKNDSGSLDFDYGAPVKVTAPAADQVVDVSKLGGR